MLHRNLESAEEVNELFAFIKGNYFAKSALEIAWWVLQAKTKDIPLFQLIGISYTESIVGGTVGVE
jgi:L-alanine-DL-glutamate epimerase-like enolase superfamily enzyme